MWLRSLTILFELRARVSQNLKTTIDINSHLGIFNTIADNQFMKKNVAIHRPSKSVQNKFSNPSNLKLKRGYDKKNDIKNGKN